MVTAFARGIDVQRLSDPRRELDGRYRLIRPIAKVSGGGSVYAGEHLFTRRACAIKLFDQNISEKLRKRTRREMDALARVQGPGVVVALRRR